MTAPININLEILNGSTEILIRIRKQACTSKTHQGFVFRCEHVGQHLLHGRGEDKASGGEARVEGGGLLVAMSLAMVHGAVWGVP